VTVTILVGDVRERLRDLPDQSAQCCVTSPPYFGLRDYGVDGQIGLEPTLSGYIAALVDVFREVRRVLRDDGVAFLNLGDSYAASGRQQIGRHDEHPDALARRHAEYATGRPKAATGGNDRTWRDADLGGLKPKDLMMVPARVAIALCDDGWWLRTSAHESIFLLTKSAKYFWDQEAVREPNTEGTIDRLRSGPVQAKSLGPKNQQGRKDGGTQPYAEANGRNIRNVWHLGPEPFPGAHFATMPTEIPRRCIKAGSRPGDTILDPFGGAGTTGLVADELDRDCILVELNPEYAEIARRRIHGAAPLFADVQVA
jgi:hypothetical protein